MESNSGQYCLICFCGVDYSCHGIAPLWQWDGKALSWSGVFSSGVAMFHRGVAILSRGVAMFGRGESHS